MQCNRQVPALLSIFMLISVSLACGTSSPSTSTRTPAPTASATPLPTQTRRPSPTPRPTRTPNFAATERAEELIAEVQVYYEQGYLATTHGLFSELDDFVYEWAQLGWYKPFVLGVTAEDFFMSAHFEWDSAYQSPDTSGCGFIFGLQSNNDHYAVFLDRAKVVFLITDSSLGFSRFVGPTRGTGRVHFDYPAEANFTLIVKDDYAYVLVDGTVAGEYTLSRSRPRRGSLGVTVLSGTNKDYGTRCKMTNLHLWLPAE